MWYDKEGNFGFKVVRPESDAFRTGVNWDKGKNSGARGKGFDVGRVYGTGGTVIVN